MNLFKLFGRKQPAASHPPVEKMDETELKLVRSIKEKPQDWRITVKQNNTHNEEWYITHAPSMIRIVIPARVAELAHDCKIGVGVGEVCYGGYFFQSEFIKEFGALAYARYQVQDAEDKKKRSDNDFKDLKGRVALWK